MQNNVVVMKLATAAGAELSLGPLFPLYERTHENIRLDPQGPAVHRKCNVKLDGFFEGNDHHELLAQYQILAAMLNKGEVKFTYTVAPLGGGDPLLMHNATVMYVETFSEPSDWKQYDGSYTINLYFFVPLDDSDLLGLGASFNGYVFPSIPTWERSVESLSQSVNDSLLPIGMPSSGSTVTITLRGMLTADTGVANPATNLQSKVNQLEAALEANNRHGLLIYNSYAAYCKVHSFVVQDTIPRQQVVYSIILKYNTATVFNLKCNRSFTRVHWNPRITEKAYCGTRSVQFLNRSGQQVTWNLSCSADTLANARAQLQVEAEARIYPGGIEMDGGDQKEDENEISVSVTIIRFYNNPVMNNIAGEGVTGRVM